MKAFLGMGLLGSNFVKAMIKKGDQLQVWNRSSAKAKELESFGAKAFGDPAQAVKGAETIHLTLKDDDTVNAVLAMASPGFEPGVTIIDHTTTSLKGAIERTTLWKSRGYTYLHAPVFMGPQNALESTGIMIVSGDQALISTFEDQLSKMTGRLINFGPQVGKAAGMKLIGNGFLLTLTAGISETFSLSKALGFAPADMMALFDSWNPGAVLPARLKRMSDGNFKDTSWSLEMARKDAGLMINAAAEGKSALSIIPGIAAQMDQWIKKGHATDDWTVIAKDNI
jgi:3-hydroxyisobutyrate dehydrogenase